MKSDSRAEIKITGIVQGVFYRSEAQKTAKSLNLTGWIKNMSNGSVHTVVEGKRENIDKYIQWCKKGSDMSKVELVEVTWGKSKDEFSKFEISYY